MKEWSDCKLLGAWRENGCNPSVTELWNRYGRLGNSVARTILRAHVAHTDDVFDVNHDSFIDSLHKFDAQRYSGPVKGAFKNYYLRLVKNRAISIWRKRRNMPKMEPFEFEGEGETQLLSNNLYQNLLVQNELLTLRQFVSDNYLTSDSALLEDWLESKRIGLRPKWREFCEDHPVSINTNLQFASGEIVASNENQVLFELIKTMNLCPEITVELQVCPKSNLELNQQRAQQLLSKAQEGLKKQFQSVSAGSKQKRLTVTTKSLQSGRDISTVVTRGAFRCPDALRMRLNAITNNYRKKYHSTSS